MLHIKRNCRRHRNWVYISKLAYIQIVAEITKCDWTTKMYCSWLESNECRRTLNYIINSKSSIPSIGIWKRSHAVCALERNANQPRWTNNDNALCADEKIPSVAKKNCRKGRDTIHYPYTQWTSTYIKHRELFIGESRLEFSPAFLCISTVIVVATCPETKQMHILCDCFRLWLLPAPACSTLSDAEGCCAWHMEIKFQ